MTLTTCSALSEPVLQCLSNQGQVVPFIRKRNQLYLSMHLQLPVMLQDTILCTSGDLNETQRKMSQLGAWPRHDGAPAGFERHAIEREAPQRRWQSLHQSHFPQAEIGQTKFQRSELSQLQD